MSEMLGNQLFLARKYSEAELQFDEVLGKEAENLSVLKKIIICNTQTGKYDLALKRFYKLISIKPELLIDTDPIYDDCPCPELIFKLEENLPLESNNLYYLAIMGVLWIYCDLEKSISYFEKSNSLTPSHNIIDSILSILHSEWEKRIESNK